MRAILSSLAILAGSLASTASAAEGTTRVAPENLEAFVLDCRANLPAATCECMATRMIAMGQDGEIALDFMGLQSRKLADEEAARKEAVAIADKYHVTFSQVQAAIEKIGAGSEDLGRSCS